MSKLPPQKDGIIELLFLVTALISIVPPTDVFSVAKKARQEDLRKHY